MSRFWCPVCKLRSYINLCKRCQYNKPSFPPLKIYHSCDGLLHAFLPALTPRAQWKLQVMKPLRLLLNPFTFLLSSAGFPLQPKMSLWFQQPSYPRLLNARRETWCWQSQFNFKWKPGCLTTHHRRLILISRHGQMSREIAVLRGKSEHLSPVMTIVLIGKINKIPYLMGTSELKGSLVLPLFISKLNTMVN